MTTLAMEGVSMAKTLIPCCTHTTSAARPRKLSRRGSKEGAAVPFDGTPFVGSQRVCEPTAADGCWP